MTHLQLTGQEKWVKKPHFCKSFPKQESHQSKIHNSFGKKAADEPGYNEPED